MKEKIFNIFKVIGGILLFLLIMYFINNYTREKEKNSELAKYKENTNLCKHIIQDWNEYKAEDNCDIEKTGLDSFFECSDLYYKNNEQEIKEFCNEYDYD